MSLDEKNHGRIIVPKQQHHPNFKVSQKKHDTFLLGFGWAVSTDQQKNKPTMTDFLATRSALYPTFSNISNSLTRASLSAHCWHHCWSTKVVPSALTLKTRLKRLSIALSLRIGGGFDCTMYWKDSWVSVLLTPRPFPIVAPFPASRSSGGDWIWCKEAVAGEGAAAWTSSTCWRLSNESCCLGILGISSSGPFSAVGASNTRDFDCGDSSIIWLRETSPLVFL